MSAAAALVVAAALAGCGTTTYFAGRTLPPSGLRNRVLIAIQNASSSSKGVLAFVDAFYDVRFSYNSKTGSFAIGGYGGALPVSIQNFPEEQAGLVYAAGDGTLVVIDYNQEKTNGAETGLNGISSSVFEPRNREYIFAASQTSHVFTVVDKTNGGAYPLSLPGVYRTSVNIGGSVALAFVQNSDFIYYPRKLTAAQTVTYAGGPLTWPKAAVDCEPQNAPGWCLFQAQSPDNTDATGNFYGAPLKFDRPVKAVFSADGGTAYVLNCGPECGGTKASVTPLQVGPMIYLTGQQSGLLPCNTAPCSNPGTSPLTTIAIPGGASNALVAGSTLYVVGQQPQVVSGQTLFTGNLTLVDLSKNPMVAGTAVSISDGAPGAVSRMLLADDNTLWIGMTKCINGVRAATGQPYGCLTMYNTSTNTVTLLESYLGDLTGIASVDGLHKIYVAQGGQVYIYSTSDGSAISNQYVSVTGTAYDVAYMDANSDTNNTVY
jgi:hypothetical protein